MVVIILLIVLFWCVAGAVGGGGLGCGKSAGICVFQDSPNNLSPFFAGDWCGAPCGGWGYLVVTETVCDL